MAEGYLYCVSNPSMGVGKYRVTPTAPTSIMSTNSNTTLVYQSGQFTDIKEAIKKVNHLIKSYKERGTRDIYNCNIDIIVTAIQEVECQQVVPMDWEPY